MYLMSVHDAVAAAVRGVGASLPALLSVLAPLPPRSTPVRADAIVTGAFGADVATSLEGQGSWGGGAEMRHQRPLDTARPPRRKDPHHLPRVHGAFIIRRLSMVALWHRRSLCVLQAAGRHGALLRRTGVSAGRAGDDRDGTIRTPDACW